MSNTKVESMNKLLFFNLIEETYYYSIPLYYNHISTVIKVFELD